MKRPNQVLLAIAFVLILIFTIFTVMVSSSGGISLSSRSASLYSPLSKDFIYAKNANERMPMASTTKIMTALVAIRNAAPDCEITVCEQAVGIEGSSLYLRAGETFTLKDLLYGLMLRSANDAAAAIAYAIGGGIENFADMMNDAAAKIGLTDTHFENPHGLDSNEHYTTANDLAKIASEALSEPLFKEIVSTKRTVITNKDGYTRIVVNHNKLLALYDGAIGVKTGFTKKSGRCLVGAAEKDGVMLVSVTLSAPDDWNDHKKLFDYGFAHVDRRTLAAPSQFTYEIPVIDSDDSASVRVENKDALEMVLRTDAAITTDVKLPRYLCAPVSKGQKVGEILFKNGNTVIGSVDLYAANSASEGKRGFPLFE